MNGLLSLAAELEMLRTAEGQGGCVAGPRQGPSWPVASHLCKLQLLKRHGEELELTLQGQDVLRRTAGRANGLCVYIPAAQREFLQQHGPMAD